MKHIVLTYFLLLFGLSSIIGQESTVQQFLKNDRSLSFVPQGGIISGYFGGGLSVRGSYFFSDKWDVGLSTGFTYYKNYETTFSLAPSVKYYPTQWRLSPVILTELPIMIISDQEAKTNIAFKPRAAAGLILLNKKRSFGIELNAGYIIQKKPIFTLAWSFSFFF